jgi:diadenylate cyclase
LVDQEQFLDILAKLAPGTPLREGLDSITSLGKGALVLIANRDKATEVIHGGFELNTDFTPQKLTELSKMDRAIIVDEDLRKILFANAMLVPDQNIKSKETGTRHLSAEVVAKQLEAPAIAVSASKTRVTLYYGDITYILPDFSTLTARVNQALHILEQYRSTLDNLLSQLTTLEFEGRVLSDDVASAVQLMVQMLKVQLDVERWFIELGDEKELQEQLLEWLMLEVEDRYEMLLKDYQHNNRKSVAALSKKILALPHEKLFDNEGLMVLLGYSDLDEESATMLYPRGYRVMHEIPRLPHVIAERLVKKFSFLKDLMSASEDDLTTVKGIGMVRARTIRASLMRLRMMYNSLA